jgi:hypothetical protein
MATKPPAQGMPPVGQLINTGLPERDLGFTDCAYVNSEDMAALAGAVNIDPASANRKGMLCHVGEAVLFVKCVQRGPFTRGAARSR